MGVKTFFTSRIKRWAKALINRNRSAQWLFRRVLTSDYATRMMLNDNAAIIDLLTHPQFRKIDSYPVIEQYVFEHALKNPTTRDRILQWINSQAQLVKSVNRNSQLKAISLREPEYLSLLIKHHDLYEDLIDRDVLEQIFKFEETLDCILDNYVLRDRLLFDERVIERMLTDERFQENLLNDPELCMHLLHDQRMIDTVLHSPDVLNELIEQPALIESLKRSSDALESLLAGLDEELLLKRFDAQTMLKRLSADQMLAHLGLDTILSHLEPHQMLAALETETILDHLTPEQMFAHLGLDTILSHLKPHQMLGALETETILDHLTPAQMFKHLGAQAMLDHLTAEQMLAQLGLDTILSHLKPHQMLESLDTQTILDHLTPEQRVEQLDADTLLENLTPEQMLEYLGTDTLLNGLTPEAMLAHLDPERMLDFLGDAEMLNRLTPEKMLASIDEETLQKHLTPEQKLNSLDEATLFKHIGVERMVQHLGPDKLFAALEPSDIVSRVKVDELIAEADPSGAHIAQYIANHPEILPTISRDEFALAEFLKSNEVREKLRLLDGLRRLAALDYPLPGAVVSYPRSGSNFLQSILRHSSGMQNVSIYGPDPAKSDPLLTVKSHALSPEYLADEFNRFIGPEKLPGRILLLKRDPRDVMISFYEFTQRQRKTTIPQEEFLENVSFFYASTIDKNHTRTIDTGPMNVIDAYRKHIREWFIDRPDSLEVLELRYEDLVDEPNRYFRDALDYLELDVSVAKAYLGIRVSLYSDDTRPRAKAHGWLDSDGKYDTIINQVEDKLADELKLLGYADVGPRRKEEPSKDADTNPTPATTSPPGKAKKKPRTSKSKGKKRTSPHNKKKS